ncbi:hypothetical protein LR48_Vigan08g066800 [Vigna angularis]|uniref:Putative plant transposon protein domain-containing protein n=1 Tax=Phaseolus angularis TaxID=3914 RepID=A0A0L9V4B6_PHAAN|nr:hypothetical protein LR48_Vigan08g066800 [Vigna angularis]
MTSSSGKRLKTIASKRKDKEPEQPHSSRFLSRKHEKHFKIVQDRRLLMERKAGMIPNFVPQFGEQLMGRNWRKLATYPALANIAVVKEFYTNAMKIGDYLVEEYLSYVRGHTIRYDPTSINSFLGTKWVGEQLVNIRRTDLTSLAKYWMAFSHANIQPCSHVSDITLSRALLLYYVLRNMSINIGPMQSIHRGQVTTAEMLIGLYDTPPAHKWTMDEFHSVVDWPEEQIHDNRARAAEASAMEEDEDEDDDAFEDDEDNEEEEDTDDNTGS